MKINKRKLESERKRLGLSRAAFSRKIGMTDSTYSKILQSQSTTLKTLSKIADALRLDWSDILTQ
jgi:transcriptional regulator with XRE-family HTH domain